MAFCRKVVGPNWYVHFSQIPVLPEQCQTLLESAKRAASSHDLSVYNVLKFHESNQRLTFLSYPDFFEEAFPVLHSFLLVDTCAQVVRYRDLKDSPNACIHTDPGAPTFPFDTDRYQPGSSLGDTHA